MPPLTLFGHGGPPVLSGKSEGDHFLFVPNYAVDPKRLTCNGILFAVPISATVGLLLGCQRIGRRLSPGVTTVLIVALVVFLALFVGTRSNPSNVGQEFGELVLVFGFWLLAILLIRIDGVYRHFVRGRRHVDALHALWNMSAGGPPATPERDREPVDRPPASGGEAEDSVEGPKAESGPGERAGDQVSGPLRAPG